ncbi:MAG: hypothetical protein WA021_05895 [Minisyncoccia bacterium]
MRNALGGKPAGMRAGVLLMALFASLLFAASFERAYAANGTVTISVQVSGGSAHAQDFKLTMKKKGSSAGVTASGDSITFSGQPATYAITASGPSRYTAVWGGDCSTKGEVVLANDTAKNCTLTLKFGSTSSSSGGSSSGGSSTPSNPRGTVRGR